MHQKAPSVQLSQAFYNDMKSPSGEYYNAHMDFPLDASNILSTGSVLQNSMNTSQRRDKSNEKIYTKINLR